MANFTIRIGVFSGPKEVFTGISHILELSVKSYGVLASDNSGIPWKP